MSKNLNKLKKSIEEAEEGKMHGPYSSVDDMMADMEKRDREERRKNPIKYYAIRFWWKIEKMWEAPGIWYGKLIEFIQRGKRGYSDKDFWELGWYLSEIIPPMLKQLKASSFRGMPNDLLDKHCKNNGVTAEIYSSDAPDELVEKIENEVCKEYDEIFDEMIWSFETALKVWNDDKMIYSEGYSDEFKEKYNVMTKEEMDRMKKGFDYFRDYFFNLWD